MLLKQPHSLKVFSKQQQNIEKKPVPLFRSLKLVETFYNTK